ncbi:hypothetical protein WME88_35540 [Sorangium sp. So ce216]
MRGDAYGAAATRSASRIAHRASRIAHRASRIAYLDEERLTVLGVTFTLGPPGPGGISWDQEGKMSAGEDGVAVETRRFAEESLHLRRCGKRPLNDAERCVGALVEDGQEIAQELHAGNEAETRRLIRFGRASRRVDEMPPSSLPHASILHSAGRASGFHVQGPHGRDVVEVTC